MVFLLGVCILCVSSCVLYGIFVDHIIYYLYCIDMSLLCLLRLLLHGVVVTRASLESAVDDSEASSTNFLNALQES